MLDGPLLLAVLASGTVLLWLVAIACYIGGKWLNDVLWWFFFEER
jgi:hypothetical protein